MTAALISAPRGSGSGGGFSGGSSGGGFGGGAEEAGNPFPAKNWQPPVNFLRLRPFLPLGPIHPLL